MNEIVGLAVFVSGMGATAGIACYYGHEIYKYFKEKKHGKRNEESGNNN